jgi:hypothetical protein
MIMQSGRNNQPSEAASNETRHAEASSNINSASKLQTDCKKEHADSLQCIQDNYETKDKSCQPFFTIYKECRKKEHAAILEKNKSRSFW